MKSFAAFTLALTLVFAVPLRAEDEPETSGPECGAALAAGKTEPTVAERLLLGEPVDGHDDPSPWALDDQAVADLGIQDLLFPQVDRATSPLGKLRVRWLLSHPSLDGKHIEARQAAVREVATDAALRARLTEAWKIAEQPLVWTHWHYADAAARGHLVSGVDRFLGVFCMIPAAGIAALGCSTGDWKTVAYAPMLSLMFGGKALEAQRFTRKMLGMYRDTFRLAEETARTLSGARSPRLRSLGARLEASLARPAVVGLRRDFAKMLPRGFATVLDAIYHHGSWSLAPVVRRLSEGQGDVAFVLSALAEVEATLAFGRFVEEKGDALLFPEVLAQPHSQLAVVQGHNPYLYFKDAAKSVPNDVDLAYDPTGRAKNFLIVTGQNMGGKTSYLKMAALELLLAQAGLPVPAKAMRFTPMRLLTNINVSDNIAQGKSFYDAETDRLKALIEESSRDPRVFVVLDEILVGTNPEEREAAERATIHYLARRGGLYLLTTHDIRVTDLEITNPHVTNRHVEEQLDQGQLRFTYRVVPGPTQHRNAITILELKGFPEELTREARTWLRTHGN